MSGLFRKRLIRGSRSVINTALPRMRAATAIEIEEDGASPVPFSINTRINATICKATKKKMVGGSSSKNSFLSVVDSLLIELNCDESYRSHGSRSRTLLERMRRAFRDRSDRVINEKAGGPWEPPAVKVVSVTGRCLWRPPPPVASFSPFQL